MTINDLLNSVVSKPVNGWNSFVVRLMCDVICHPILHPVYGSHCSPYRAKVPLCLPRLNGAVNGVMMLSRWRRTLKGRGRPLVRGPWLMSAACWFKPSAVRCTACKWHQNTDDVHELCSAPCIFLHQPPHLSRFWLGNRSAMTAVTF